MQNENTGMKFLDKLEEIAAGDVAGLKKAAASYGDSWKRRGGCGAFMMLARNWDRIEIAVKKHDYDIFAAIAADNRSENLLDHVNDICRYLTLVRAEMLARGVKFEHRDNVPEPVATGSVRIEAQVTPPGTSCPKCGSLGVTWNVKPNTNICRACGNSWLEK